MCALVLKTFLLDAHSLRLLQNAKQQAEYASFAAAMKTINVAFDVEIRVVIDV